MKTISPRNCYLESRMRENRPSGSEGGGAACRSPYPYQDLAVAPSPLQNAKHLGVR